MSVMVKGYATGGKLVKLPSCERVVSNEFEDWSCFSAPATFYVESPNNALLCDDFSFAFYLMEGLSYDFFEVT